jgi:galactonate dehydratase
MYRSQYFEGGRVLTAAISAIDMALHDVVGRALGVPVYQLLGGRQRDRVPCFATVKAHSLELLTARTRALLSEGWKVIRTGILSREEREGEVFDPRDSIALNAEWLTLLREALGPDFVLGIDYHHRLTVPEAASFCQRLPAGTLDFLEEPIRDECPSAYEALRKLVTIPFAIGEEFASKWQFLPYLERDITQFARVDVCLVGGLTEAMKVAALAEAHYIDLMPHAPLGPICTAATAHLAAAVPNFAWFEYRNDLVGTSSKLEDALFPKRCAMEGTMLCVSDEPGLGVEFNESLAAEQEFKFWEAPHLRRSDGSYTNW